MVIPVGSASHQIAIQSRVAKFTPATDNGCPATGTPTTLNDALSARTARNGNSRIGTRRMIGIVASASRRRRRVGLGRRSVLGRSLTHRVPFQNMRLHPFGDPADYVSPVALRPRLATGVLFRGLQCVTPRVVHMAPHRSCEPSPLKGDRTMARRSCRSMTLFGQRRDDDRSDCCALPGRAARRATGAWPDRCPKAARASERLSRRRDRVPTPSDCRSRRRFRIPWKGSEPRVAAPRSRTAGPQTPG